jgi:hypothetical protein
VTDAVTILVAARDEAGRIGPTVRALRKCLPDAAIVVADDGSRDGTAVEARAAGATVLRLPRRGKGQALSAAAQSVPPGKLLLVDADLEGDPAPLLESDADLGVAAFAERQGGGFGIVKACARLLVRRLGGIEVREPLSGQRVYSSAARVAAFPLAPGFGCEARGTIDVARAGLRVEEVELPLRHRATGRDAGGFLHRGRQLLDLLLGVGPLAVNHRGLRLPLVGWTLVLGRSRTASAVALVGLADDLWSGPERGFRAHLRARRTTGVLKLVAIPAIGLLATRRISGAVLVGLAANVLNQLDTKPGRALKAFLVAAVALRGPALGYAGRAVLLLPYDLREMAMLGDAGSNALGALLGLSSVDRFTGRGRGAAIAGLAGLTVLAEYRSVGELIERTPLLRDLDALGRS